MKVTYLTPQSPHCIIQVKTGVFERTCQHFVLRSFSFFTGVCQVKWTDEVVKLDKGNGEIVFLLLKRVKIVQIVFIFIVSLTYRKESSVKHFSQAMAIFVMGYSPTFTRY